MGLGSFSTGGSATYLRIGMGKDDKGNPRAIIGKRAKEGDPGAVQVFKADGNPAIDKDGHAVYRTEHAFIEGVVKRIARDEPEYNGKKVEVLNITIDAGVGQLFVLQLDKGDQYWGDLALRMPGIDWTKSVKLVPYSIPREDNPDKRNRYFVPYQGGNKIVKAWDEKSDPATAPPPPVFDKDEKKWLWGKRNNWLDVNVVQEAIDMVAFLNERAPADDADLALAGETALDAASRHAKQQAAKPVEKETDPFQIPDEGESDLSF